MFAFIHHIHSKDLYFGEYINRDFLIALWRFGITSKRKSDDFKNLSKAVSYLLEIGSAPESGNLFRYREDLESLNKFFLRKYREMLANEKHVFEESFLNDSSVHLDEDVVDSRVTRVKNWFRSGLRFWRAHRENRLSLLSGYSTETLHDNLLCRLFVLVQKRNNPVSACLWSAIAIFAVLGYVNIKQMTASNAHVWMFVGLWIGISISLFLLRELSIYFSCCNVAAMAAKENLARERGKTEKLNDWKDVFLLNSFGSKCFNHQDFINASNHSFVISRILALIKPAFSWCQDSCFISEAEEALRYLEHNSFQNSLPHSDIQWEFPYKKP